MEIRVTPQKGGAANAEVRYRWSNRTRRWQLADREGPAHVIPIPQGRSVETWGKLARLYLTFTGWNPEAEGELDVGSGWLDERKKAIEQKKRRKQMQARVEEPATVGAG